MPLFKCNFISYTFKRAVDISVIIPGLTSTEAGVPDCTHRPRWKYPVLYLLHGYLNDYSVWGRYTSIERYAEERQIAVVMFSGENNFYMNLEDVKTQSGIKWLIEPDYQTFLMTELPDFVTSMFPVSERPEDTYIAGLSMGGFGAMCSGFRFPARFRAVGAFSPLPCLERKKYRDEILPDEWRAYDPLTLIRRARKEGTLPAFYYCYGAEDFLFEIQEWFREVLEREAVPCTIEVLPGYGHEWAFWDLEVKQFLDWIPRTDPYYRECPIRQI